MSSVRFEKQFEKSILNSTKARVKTTLACLISCQLENTF